MRVRFTDTEQSPEFDITKVQRLTDGLLESFQFGLVSPIEALSAMSSATNHLVQSILIRSSVKYREENKALILNVLEKTITRIKEFKVDEGEFKAVSPDGNGRSSSDRSLHEP